MIDADSILMLAAALSQGGGSDPHVCTNLSTVEMFIVSSAKTVPSAYGNNFKHAEIFDGSPQNDETQNHHFDQITNSVC